MRVWARAGDEAPVGHWQQRVSCVREHIAKKKKKRGRGQGEGRTIVGHGDDLGDAAAHTLRFSNFPNEETEVQETRCPAQEPSGRGGCQAGRRAEAGFRAPRGLPVVPGTDSGL